MKKNLYREFINKLNHELKDDCVLLIMNLLENGTNLKEIYDDYLIPSLADYTCDSEVQEICIWKEHTRTSIIRTILESTYPFLIKEKKAPINKSIVIACPQHEYHEIGAIIATNFFILEGFDAKYIGANTPSDEIFSAVKILKPDYLALSITNYYNLVATKKLTERLKDSFPQIKIIIGGQAAHNEQTLGQIDFDFVIQTYEDIVKFKEGLK